MDAHELHLAHLAHLAHEEHEEHVAHEEHLEHEEVSGGSLQRTLLIAGGGAALLGLGLFFALRHKH